MAVNMYLVSFLSFINDGKVVVFCLSEWMGVSHEIVASFFSQWLCSVDAHNISQLFSSCKISSAVIKLLHCVRESIWFSGETMWSTVSSFPYPALWVPSLIMIRCSCESFVQQLLGASSLQLNHWSVFCSYFTPQSWRVFHISFN